MRTRVRQREAFERISSFVEECLAGAIMRHGHDRAHAEAQQNSLFDPAIHAPARGRSGVRLGGANAAVVQTVL